MNQRFHPFTPMLVSALGPCGRGVLNAVLCPTASSHMHGWDCCSVPSPQGVTGNLLTPPLSADIGRGRKRSKLQSIQRSVTGRLWGVVEVTWLTNALPSCPHLAFEEGDPRFGLWGPPASVHGWAIHRMWRCRHELTSGGCPCRRRVVSGPGRLAPSPPPYFSLHLDALSGLTRPVLGNEETAAFAYWLIYPDFFNYLSWFSNPYLSYNHKAEETFIYFNLFLKLFSFFFFSLSLSFLISRQEA